MDLKKTTIMSHLAVGSAAGLTLDDNMQGGGFSFSRIILEGATGINRKADLGFAAHMSIASLWMLLDAMPSFCIFVHHAGSGVALLGISQCTVYWLSIFGPYLRLEAQDSVSVLSLTEVGIMGEGADEYVGTWRRTVAGTMDVTATYSTTSIRLIDP